MHALEMEVTLKRDDDLVDTFARERDLAVGGGSLA